MNDLEKNEMWNVFGGTEKEGGYYCDVFKVEKGNDVLYARVYLPDDIACDYTGRIHGLSNARSYSFECTPCFVEEDIA